MEAFIFNSTTGTAHLPDEDREPICQNVVTEDCQYEELNEDESVAQGAICQDCEQEKKPHTVRRYSGYIDDSTIEAAIQFEENLPPTFRSMVTEKHNRKTLAAFCVYMVSDMSLLDARRDLYADITTLGDLEQKHNELFT